uniref:Uncharacterized protein n=1 Tax=Romanomermis culicivorax TaxID=13658 RepID=A0A915K1V1_ROMCU
MTCNQLVRDCSTNPERHISEEGFAGVFARDQLNGMITRYPAAIIANTDMANEPASGNVPVQNQVEFNVKWLIR